MSPHPSLEGALPGWLIPALVTIAGRTGFSVLSSLSPAQCSFEFTRIHHKHESFRLKTCHTITSKSVSSRPQQRNQDISWTYAKETLTPNLIDTSLKVCHDEHMPLRFPENMVSMYVRSCMQIFQSRSLMCLKCLCCLWSLPELVNVFWTKSGFLTDATGRAQALACQKMVSYDELVSSEGVWDLFWAEQGFRQERLAGSLQRKLPTQGNLPNLLSTLLLDLNPFLGLHNNDDEDFNTPNAKGTTNMTRLGNHLMRQSWTKTHKLNGWFQAQMLGVGYWPGFLKKGRRRGGGGRLLLLYMKCWSDSSFLKLLLAVGLPPLLNLWL